VTADDERILIEILDILPKVSSPYHNTWITVNPLRELIKGEYYEGPYNNYLRVDSPNERRIGKYKYVYYTTEGDHNVKCKNARGTALKQDSGCRYVYDTVFF